MKKAFSILLVTFLITCFFGCNKSEKADLTIDLAAVPVSAEGNLLTAVKQTMRVDFEVPEKGCLKLISYDCTEYEQWPEIHPEIYVTFVNRKNETLYPETFAGGGFTEKFIFEKGTVSVVVSVKNFNENMDCISFEWAFAPANGKVAEVKADEKLPALCMSSEDGTADFIFNAPQNALYNFICSEACTMENSCSFYIENENGENITGNLSVHATEWTARTAFLAKGSYKITVCDIPAVASVRAFTDKTYDNVIIQQTEEAEIPADFGFSGADYNEKSAKLIADGSAKRLTIQAEGTGTYYENEQEFFLRITDAQCNEITLEESEEYFCGTMSFDISHLSGEYTVSVGANGSCVVSLRYT